MERFVRACEAYAARSGQRVRLLRATIRGADVDVAAEFEEMAEFSARGVSTYFPV